MADQVFILLLTLMVFPYIIRQATTMSILDSETFKTNDSLRVTCSMDVLDWPKDNANPIWVQIFYRPFGTPNNTNSRQRLAFMSPSNFRDRHIPDIKWKIADELPAGQNWTFTFPTESEMKQFPFGSPNCREVAWIKATLYNAQSDNAGYYICQIDSATLTRVVRSQTAQWQAPPLSLLSGGDENILQRAKDTLQFSVNTIFTCGADSMGIPLHPDGAFRRITKLKISYMLFNQTKQGIKTLAYLTPKDQYANVPSDKRWKVLFPSKNTMTASAFTRTTMVIRVNLNQVTCDDEGHFYCKIRDDGDREMRKFQTVTKRNCP